jgi:hypothetical protein
VSSLQSRHVFHHIGEGASSITLEEAGLDVRCCLSLGSSQYSCLPDHAVCHGFAGNVTLELACGWGCLYLNSDAFRVLQLRHFFHTTCIYLLAEGASSTSSCFMSKWVATLHTSSELLAPVAGNSSKDSHAQGCLHSNASITCGVVQ